HVTTNVGGIYTFNKTYDQEGMVHIHVEKAKQRQSVLFMNSNVFATPHWLLDENVLGRINRDGIVEDIKRLQNYGLSRILNESRLKRMVENEALNSNQAYKLSELYRDLRNGLWGELSRGTTVDPFRRNIQRAHIDLLGELLKSESDVGAISRAELKAIQRMAISGGSRSSDPMTKMHLEDLQVRIGQLLDPQ
ncbi:MAG: zinc-dependent metalloprotease, partial [Cyclobacteriaceae bacterium]|nr:zinc-dependent metalloprotease [Cyclobacteriaceae bacterium]